MAITRTSTIDTASDTTCHGPNLEMMNKRGVLVLGDTGQQFVRGPQRYVDVFQDFTGGSVAFSATLPAGPNAFRSRVGTTNAVAWTTTGAAGGTVVGTIGDTTASMAVSGVQLDSGLDWRADQGDLWFEARVKQSTISTIAVFIGFTDQVSALEMPIQSAASANTLTTNASDAVGFMFDTSMTADTWWLVGVAANTDATHQNTALAPVADTYATFRVELSTAGVATFYYNGAEVGTAMTGAVTATTLLTPVIAGFNRTTTGTPTITADYVYVSGLRV
jgi:hypothetical protein